MKDEVTKTDLIYYIWIGNSKLREVTKAAGKKNRLKKLQKSNSDSLVNIVINQFLDGYFKKEDADFINGEVKRLERKFC